MPHRREGKGGEFYDDDHDDVNAVTAMVSTMIDHFVVDVCAPCYRCLRHGPQSPMFQFRLR